MILIPQYRTSRRASAAGDFNPLDDADLMLWIDPSDLSTLWQDTSASTAVTTSTNPVDLAQDKSGNGRDLIGVGSTARPTYNTSGGLHWLNFDGANDYLYRTDAFMYAAGAVSIFVGWYSATATGNRYFLSEGNSADADSVYSLVVSSTTTGSNATNFIRTDAATVLLANSVNMGVINDSAAHVVSMIDSGSGVTPYIDGVAGSERTYTRATTTLNRFAIGALLRSTAGSYMAGRVYQLLIVGRAVNSTDRANYEQFVADRCGVTL